MRNQQRREGVRRGETGASRYTQTVEALAEANVSHSYSRALRALARIIGDCGKAGRVLLRIAQVADANNRIAVRIDQGYDTSATKRQLLQSPNNLIHIPGQ